MLKNINLKKLSLSSIISVISLILSIIGVIISFVNYPLFEFKNELVVDNINSNSFILFLDSFEFLDKIFLFFGHFENFSVIIKLISFISFIMALIGVFTLFHISWLKKNIEKFVKMVMKIILIIGLVTIFYIEMLSTQHIIDTNMNREIKSFNYCNNNYEIPNTIRKEYFSWDNYIEGKKNEDNNIDNIENNGNISITADATNLVYEVPNGICFYYNNGEIVYGNESEIIIKNLGPLGPYLFRGVYFDIPPIFKLVSWNSELDDGEIAIILKIDGKEIDMYNQNKSFDIEIPSKKSIKLTYEIKLKHNFKIDRFFMRFPIYFNISFNTV